MSRICEICCNPAPDFEPCPLCGDGGDDICPTCGGIGECFCDEATAEANQRWEDWCE